MLELIKYFYWGYIVKKVFCLLSFLGVFSNSFSNNLDTNFENDTKNFRQENLLMEQKIRDNELKNFNPTDIKVEELEVNNENENKFLINNINITDSDNLLSFSEKDKVINKYINKELGASDIKNILMELTNKIVLKGYSTSSVGIRKNDLSTGILDLEIVAGKIEAVVFNEEDNLDKIKKFFLFSFKENDILNIRNIDTTSENFNYLQANNISIEILPGTKENYSIIKATNIMKDKFTIGLTTNNHGENYQDAFWRGGTYFNIDSPLGIGDNFYFSYTSVHKKDPDRSWKDVPDVPSPGEILPIGPKGYDPSKGETLPNKRRLDMFNLRYTTKFRNNTLKFTFSKTLKDTSFYAFNTVYDLKSSNDSFALDLERIIWRNQKSKLSLDLGIKTKHSQNYLERATLYDRRLTIGNIGLNYTTTVMKGILGLNLIYERGLTDFGAERDTNKIDTTPKAQFKKYDFSTTYYKPLTERIVSRTNLISSYSSDVLYPSEKQSVGGLGSVPGYHRKDNLSGDKAIEIGEELSYNYKINNLGTLSPYISYSYGAIENNRDKSKYGTGYATGGLVGVRYSAKYLDFDFGYAKAFKHSAYLKPKNYEIYFSANLKYTF